MVQRPRWLAEIRTALKRSRATALIAPRQSGKTTLAPQIVPADSQAYFDLEDPRSLARLAEPMTVLAPLWGVVVIDEIQRRPDLCPILRALSDKRPPPARFLILGSASPDLLRHSSEMLAGRLETVTLSGFGLDELGQPRFDGTGGGERSRPRTWRVRSRRASSGGSRARSSSGARSTCCARA